MTASVPEGLVVVTMPFPVSTHEAFRKHNGSHLSERYRKWRDEAGWVLLSQRPGKVVGPVKLLIELCKPDKRARDTDNFIKGPVDLLVSHLVIEGDDDSIVREVTARWVTNGEPCTVTIARASE